MYFFVVKLGTTQIRRLNPEQRDKLEEFFQRIISNSAIDFTKDEMTDIQAAMKTMLERIRTRVNSRGIFNIASVVPAGSMRERTSLWKFDDDDDDDDEQYYIEFDFLAQIHQCTKQTAEIECKGCLKIVKPPVDLQRVRQYYSDEFNEESLEDKEVISDLFLNEINYCLTSACNCLTFHSKKDDYGDYLISLRPSSEHHKHGCGECTVEMPTGTLHVNTEIYIEQRYGAPNKCSLIFQWTSKVKSLSAPDKRLLQEPQPVSQLPIFVDFLPALESLAPSSSGAGEERGFFIVPKDCNVCDSSDNFYYRWRKSWCIAELNAFTTDMSAKHRNCYQIIKYFSEILFLPSYHIKTIVLRHHTECTDTTDDLVQCVLKIYQDLHHAYKTEELLSYQSNLNILQMSNSYSDKKLCEKFINMMCSVSVTDTWETLSRKIQKL